MGKTNQKKPQQNHLLSASYSGSEIVTLKQQQQP